MALEIEGFGENGLLTAERTEEAEGWGEGGRSVSGLWEEDLWDFL